jgi:hypothetical protein
VRIFPLQFQQVGWEIVRFFFRWFFLENFIENFNSKNFSGKFKFQEFLKYFLDILRDAITNNPLKYHITIPTSSPSLPTHAHYSTRIPFNSKISDYNEYYSINLRENKR